MSDDSTHHSVLSFFESQQHTFLCKGLRILPVPRWTALAKIGQSKLVTSLWFWAVLTPIAARIVSSFPESLSVPFYDTPITVTLVLPFSWIAFYFASLSTAAGQLVFATRCPSVIQSYPTWKSVTDKLNAMETAQSFAELLVSRRFYLSNTRYKPSNEVASELFIHFDGEDGTYSLDQNKLSDLNSATERLRTLLVTPLKIKNLMSIGRVYGDVARYWSRAVCTVLYCIGFFLFFVVLFQNIQWVVTCIES